MRGGNGTDIGFDWSCKVTWLRPWCWLFGHKYLHLRINRRKNFNLSHLHPLAGMDAVCLRCGDKFEDAFKSFGWDEIEELIP